MEKHFKAGPYGTIQFPVTIEADRVEGGHDGRAFWKFPLGTYSVDLQMRGKTFILSNLIITPDDSEKILPSLARIWEQKGLTSEEVAYLRDLFEQTIASGSSTESE